MSDLDILSALFSVVFDVLAVAGAIAVVIVVLTVAWWRESHRPWTKP